MGRGKSEEKYFIYNDRLISQGNGPWENKRVTVTYEEDPLDTSESPLAVKIVVHE